MKSYLKKLLSKCHLTSRKTITPGNYNRIFLWPYLDEINRDFTDDILESLKNEPFTIDKNKRQLEIDVGIFLYHIVGQLEGLLKIFKDPPSPELHSCSQEMLEYFYVRWGKGEDRDKFISEIRKKYIDKVKAYAFYQSQYSRSEMGLEDLEACVAVILLGVKYEELTMSFIKVIEELHKGSTSIIFNVLKVFKKEFIISNSA
ncbi:MAG: hypothetical protein NT141_04485 [candidate division WWE3 bacterium]|nr:hypothetical protein [candidate division WWE3 bacterium]